LREHGSDPRELAPPEVHMYAYEPDGHNSPSDGGMTPISGDRPMADEFERNPSSDGCVATAFELALAAIALDELLDIEGVHLAFEFAFRVFVVGVAHGVVHHLDDE